MVQSKLTKMSNFGHAKSAIKNFHQISNFSFLGGGGVHHLTQMYLQKKSTLGKTISNSDPGVGGTSAGSSEKCKVYG